ncbi:unnamed protein product [Parascedosporium putredinis]|uniref:Uncharacterized protein n=1 Tax=Parascedosporium putredinis TaxID=1442378 RepID=A0A9P1H387_9PEZI|nr:unnamed protein product [Parascedosporium putredinis]CAI7994314.1 unnamed protein product [Parascedosporium putredinis]
MASNPGEENVATLYGDIHYFYGPPTQSPRHHRFDKGSYVYLFESAAEKRARIEIANNVGTDDQDAFEGWLRVLVNILMMIYLTLVLHCLDLDMARLRYSYKQHCVVSLTVDAEANDPSEWHLATYDPHNENKYHYKLHSLDIYFWTQRDALQFVNAPGEDPTPDDGAANPLAMAMAYDTQPQAFGAGFPPPLHRQAVLECRVLRPLRRINSEGPHIQGCRASPPRHDYSVHQQMYRPEEGEPVPKFAAGKSKLEEQTGRLERGVGGMFKKFEKRFG